MLSTKHKFIIHLGRTNVNQTSDFDIAPPPATGLPNMNIEDENSSENSNNVKTPTPQNSTQSYLNAKSTPDRDTGSATPLSGQSSTVYTPVQGNSQPRLSLSLRGPNLPGIPDVEIELTSPTTSSNLIGSSCSSNDRTMFQAVQSLVQISSMGSKVSLCVHKLIMGINKGLILISFYTISTHMSITCIVFCNFRRTRFDEYGNQRM